jgi:hypothetical protein
MPKNANVLDEFGEMVVRDVYDHVISLMADMMSSPSLDPSWQRIHTAYTTLDDRSAKVVQSLVMDAIDQTFANFLNFFDAREIKVMMNSKGGKTVDVVELSDGLAVEPYTDEGWIARYSKFKKGLRVPRKAASKLKSTSKSKRTAKTPRR